MRRKLLIVVAVLAILLVSFNVSNPIFATALAPIGAQPASASVTSTTLNPVADAYVDSTYPSTNYGTLTQIRLDGSPTVRSYLRFSVQGLTSAVTKATLKIYANSSLSTGYTASRVADNTWGESTINYGNAPTLGTAIGTSAAIAAATWTSVDVTPYVTGNGTFSIALTSANTTALSLASRESANKPQLILETSSTVATATPGSVPSSAVTFKPSADSYVNSAYPSTNYGTSTQIRTDGSPVLRGYVRFSVQGLTAGVTKATLKIYANSALSAGYTASRVADNTWGETSISYGNAPAVGSAIGSSGAIAASTWTSVDVTPYVTGNGTFSFALVNTDSTALSLASREAANAPQLVVQAGSGTLPSPTPTSVVVNTPTPIPPPPTSTPVSTSDPVILATGDSRSGCDSGPVAVAKLLDTLPSSWPILFNGDATNTGAYTEFTDCFNTTYGRHKAQLKPVPGNHEYMTAGASGYYQYYGAQAGPSGKGYYSFNVGTWHVVNLNSEIDISSTSAQVAWLKSDLAANPAKCTIAMWHRPRFSSGEHGNNTDTGPLFQALYDGGAELVFNGHDHDYERFAPQSPSGALDTARGIREFVVGMGGVPLRTWATIRPNSEARNNTNWGALKLTLHASSYDWQFLPANGGTFSDSGSTACH